MDTQFDCIAKEFSSTVNQTKEYVRVPLFNKLVGEVKGKSVADFGCGDGFFTRLLAKKLASSVIGVDYSKQLIDEAVLKEKKDLLGIKYVLADVRTLHLGEQVDVITAIYLLDYAKSKEDLFRMASSIYNHLNKGGSFCAVVPHPKTKPMKDFEYERRVTAVNGSATIIDGDELKCEIKKDGSLFDFNFYYYSRETYEKALKEVGFKQISWIEPIVSPEGLEKFGKEYWAGVLKNPTTIGLKCIKE